MPRKKNYADEVYGHMFESGNYYIDPDYFNSKSMVDAAPRKMTKEMFNPISIERRKVLPLTEEQINNNGVNAALSMAYHGESPTIPTYKGGVLLPEISVTPKYNYVSEPLNNHRIRFRRSLEKRGGLVRIY